MIVIVLPSSADHKDDSGNYRARLSLNSFVFSVRLNGQSLTDYNGRRRREEQTKTAEPRIVPLPSVLAMMLREIKPKKGLVFSDTNLRVEWEKACDACGQGKRMKMEPRKEDGFVWYKYKGLLLHDLRRSAVRNLRIAGVDETVIMRISGHKTAEVFRRYNIVSTDDVTNAMRRLETSSDRSVTVSAKKTKRLSASRSN